MANFLLFVPGVAGADPEILRRIGLGDLLVDGGVSFADCQRGPSGRAGVLCWMDSRHRPLENNLPIRYRPEELEWTASVEDDGRPAGRFWIGIDPARLPDHDALIRRRPYPGFSLGDAAGRLWTIPDSTRAVTVPRRRASGKIEWEDSPDLEPYVEACRDVRENMVRELAIEELLPQIVESPTPDDVIDTLVNADDPRVITVTEGADIVYRGLRLNYRLTDELIDMLGILDSQVLVRGICLAIGLPQLHADVNAKKKELVDSVSNT